MDVLVPIGIIGLLVVVNGLFVAAEFAIVGAPRPTSSIRPRRAAAWRAG